jgi:thiol-disulfide isomerase/thioredoxin
LPDIRLAPPKDSIEREYLGLSGNDAFTIPQIKANVVIIEIFSMYCPHCQAEAPVVNSLYAKIENDPALKGKIKLIGIGIGNSPFEVGIFRKKYTIPFPLFGDGDFVIHKMVGEVRTPYFIAIKINTDGSHKVVFSKLGRMEGADQFIATIAKLAELPVGGHP